MAATALEVLTGYLRQATRRRRAAQNIAHFRQLIQVPGDLAAGITMPANARLGIASSAAISSGALLLTVNGEALGVKEADADVISVLNAFVEVNKIVAIDAAAPAATYELYVIDNWHRPFLIATTEVV